MTGPQARQLGLTRALREFEELLARLHHDDLEPIDALRTVENDEKDHR
jgi:hypothetical protein